MGGKKYLLNFLIARNNLPIPATYRCQYLHLYIHKV